MCLFLGGLDTRNSAHILTKKRIVLPIFIEICSDIVYVNITCQDCF